MAKKNSFPRAHELREKSSDELKEMLAEKRKQLATITFKHKISQYEQTDDLRKTRRLIARLETLLVEKGQ